MAFMLAALGFSLLMYSVVLVIVIVLIVGGVIMNSSKPRLKEWAKQVAIWLAISSLLPLVAWYGTAAFTPDPHSAESTRAQSRLEERLNTEQSPAQKDKLRAEIDQRKEQQEKAERVFEQRMFWIGFPIGMLAMIVGVFIRVQSVGSGLMFGAIATLSSACFESWDYLGPFLRLSCLIVALAVVIVLGLVRFRSTEGDYAPTTV